MARSVWPLFIFIHIFLIVCIQTFSWIGLDMRFKISCFFLVVYVMRIHIAYQHTSLPCQFTAMLESKYRETLTPKDSNHVKSESAAKVAREESPPFLLSLELTNKHCSSPASQSTKHALQPSRNHYYCWVNSAINVWKVTRCTVAHMILPNHTITAF